MTIYIQIKKLGKRIRTVGSLPYKLDNDSTTLRELIRAMVSRGVADYNHRLTQQEPIRPLSDAELRDMSEVGKIAFGLRFGQKAADPEKAVDTALLGFSDGLYRFFINEQEITQLDAPLQLREGDTVAIIRLVMLTGGFF